MRQVQSGAAADVPRQHGSPDVGRHRLLGRAGVRRARRRAVAVQLQGWLCRVRPPDGLRGNHQYLYMYGYISRRMYIKIAESLSMFVLIVVNLRSNELLCAVFQGILNGQLKDSWCRSCHSKLSVTAESVRFLNLQAATIGIDAFYLSFVHNSMNHVFARNATVGFASASDASSAVHVATAKVKKVPKDPAIKLGSALPDEGACRHYKKSFRWFRCAD